MQHCNHKALYQMRLFLLIIISAIFFSSKTVAQIEDLSKDSAFFSQQALAYQNWLDQSGLGKTLHVKTIEVEPQQLALYLAFSSENTDSVAAAWNRLKADFDAQEGLMLEQALFYKMLHLMEIRQSLANVQLYDTYNTRKEPCFHRAIYVQDGEFRIDSSSCKSQKVDVYLSPSDLSTMKKPSVAGFKNQFTQTFVFDKIYGYAQQRYAKQKPGCINRYPTVGPPQEDGNVLRFEVADLCKEVLTDESNHFVCDWLTKIGKPCNWIKREKLTLTFTYHVTDAGCRITCDVDGKFGSGYYDTVKRGGYLDMDIDFNTYLKAYATNFQYELKKAILGN